MIPGTERGERNEGAGIEGRKNTSLIWKLLSKSRYYEEIPQEKTRER